MMRFPIGSAAALLLLALQLAAHAALAQSAATNNADARPIVLGHARTLHSQTLGEDRELLIYTPPSYGNSDATRYPVLYLLDGDGHFHHTTGLMDFLVRNRRMPEMIVVGIPNTDRPRDLTPTPKVPNERLPTAGGANHFLDFLADELTPFIDAGYRTHPYRVLVGHSFGGLFAIHALQQRPEAFDAYIAISPSLWWDERSPTRRVETFLKSTPDAQETLYITMGNEGGDMMPSAQELVKLLEAEAPAGLAWQFRHLPDEDHGSVPHRSTYDGLTYIFSDWRLPPDLEENGALADIDAHFANLADKYGYAYGAPEDVVNRLGYRHLQQGEIAEALAAFQANVDRYPKSANVYDSLGDALDAAGRHEEARDSYERACTLGRATDHPGTNVFCTNFERLAKQTGRAN